MVQTRRFQPYQRYRVRVAEYMNADAGPSHIQSVGLPTAQDSRSISGETANATDEPSNEEENKAPVSKFYHPHTPHSSD